ncbi:MAG: adhesin transport system outer membrane protein [Alphaproteobacteria bacterium]
MDSPSRRSTQQEDFFDTRRSTTLTITQNLFNGFATDSNVEIAKLAKRRASLNLRIAEQEVLFDGVRSYLNVVKQSRLLDIAKKNERTLQDQLDLESARVERGSGLAVDVLQAKSRLQLARERIVSLLGDLREAHSVYLELFNRPAVPPQMAVPKIPQDSLPETMEAALSTATGESPVLKRSNSDVDIASEIRSFSQSTYWPKIDLVGEGGWEKNVDGIPGVRREGQVTVRAIWSLFDGFLTPATSARASKNYSAELDRRRNTDRDVQNKVRQAWSKYRTSGEQRELLKNAVNIATEVFDARKKLRRAGKESLINVLDAENELNSARLRFTDATFNNILAAYRVLFQTGRLTPETLNLFN